MKKKGYYEYDPVIYPRKVWVHIGTNFKELASEIFEGELIFDDKTCDGAVFEEVIRKSDDKYGILATFPSSKKMTMEVCSHEASHICDAIEKAIGMEHGGEASAYLLGWIASCINKARLGIGDFIELKHETENEK